MLTPGYARQVTIRPRRLHLATRMKGTPVQCADNGRGARRLLKGIPDGQSVVLRRMLSLSRFVMVELLLFVLLMCGMYFFVLCFNIGGVL